MLTRVRLVKRTERRWNGNGFGYTPCSYYLMYGNWTLATVEPGGVMNWRVREGDDGPIHHFWKLADVRAWGNKRISADQPLPRVQLT
jgi:hypothetical protein